MTLEEAERAEAIEKRMAELHDEMQNDELADEAFTALETENDRLAEELEALDRRPSFLPPELAPRVGAFLTLSQSGSMVLDETYYSETPIRVTVVEPEPVDGDVEGEQVSDDTDDGDAASDRVIQAPTFRIEEGATTATTGNTDKVVDPDNAAPGGKALSQVLSDQLAMQRRGGFDRQSGAGAGLHAVRNGGRAPGDLLERWHNDPGRPAAGSDPVEQHAGITRPRLPLRGT
jgi:ParB family chromosome partitioning protein